MTQFTRNDECPSAQLAAAIEVIQRDDAEGLAQVERLLGDYDRDARLHFLRGSLLAALRRYDEARSAMTRAIEVGPDFAIARFQLGFLELTSGNAQAAEAVWGPLEALGPDNALRVLAAGLNHLARDEFEPAFELIERGMALNTENPVLNRDMQLLMDTTKEKLNSPPDDSEPSSATHLLLQQYKANPTKH